MLYTEDMKVERVRAAAGTSTELNRTLSSSSTKKKPASLPQNQCTLLM
jgi:hypothetical protein